MKGTNQQVAEQYYDAKHELDQQWREMTGDTHPFLAGLKPKNSLKSSTQWLPARWSSSRPTRMLCDAFAMQKKKSSAVASNPLRRARCKYLQRAPAP